MDNNEMFSFYKAALQGAITSPLCADYKSEWRGCGNDKDKLVKLVMRQQSLPYFITHCYKGKGLSKEYIQRTFADYINESTKKAVIFDADGVKGYTYSIYVAFEGIFKAVTDVLTAMWCNNTSVTIRKAKCPILYVGCGSTVHWPGSSGSRRVLSPDWEGRCRRPRRRGVSSTQRHPRPR